MSTEEIQVSGSDLEEKAARATYYALELAIASQSYDDAHTAQVLAATWAQIRTVNGTV